MEETHVPFTASPLDAYRGALSGRQPKPEARRATVGTTGQLSGRQPKPKRPKPKRPKPEAPGRKDGTVTVTFG